MNVLIIYATSEGHTRTVAEFVAECLRRRGHSVILGDAQKGFDDFEVTAFDAVVLASRVHAGRHHRAILAFAHKHHVELASMRGAFLSVSMAAARQRPGDERRLIQYREQFEYASRWKPECFLNVAGARLYSRHNLVVRWILGIVDGHRYDTGQDHDFTDWPDLERSVEKWISRDTSHRTVTPT